MQSAVKGLLDDIERRRQAVSSGLSAKHRASLGQFFTPPTAAAFLAELLEFPDAGRFQVLDPGAGVGSLSAAVAARVINERPDLELHITAFEVDEALVPHLSATLAGCVAVAAKHGVIIEFDVRNASFVEYATGWLFEQPRQFDAVIANPPYKKVNTGSPSAYRRKHGDFEPATSTPSSLAWPPTCSSRVARCR